MRENRFVKNKLTYWLFLLPSLFAFIIVVFIPFLMGVYYSLTDWNAIAGEKANWRGLANYVNMFSDVKFQYSFFLTFLFATLSVIVINIVALCLAILVTRNIKFKGFFRAGFFLPNLIGGLVLGYIWQFIFKSVIPSIGSALGIEAIENFLILADPTLTLVGLIFAFTWQYAGYIMMIYVAAILNVPQELTEAAQIDGASSWQRFRNVTMPLIAQAFTITSFLTIVNSFKQFDIVIALTNGGPSIMFNGEAVNSTELLAVHIYNEAFRYNDMAQGQARAIIFFLVLSVISIIQVRHSQKKEVEL